VLSGVSDALDRDRSAASHPPPLPGTFDVVVVKRNENLGRMAQRLYGDRRHAETIFRMNRDKLVHIDRIYAGMSLRVPKGESLEPGSAASSPGATGAAGKPQGSGL
jgi:nucleoid-associated protein YgaU